jgi:bifunctional DNA-binding transcriptional regulator/antitoxin component of YhaV-PrlF toxin-antitoxin module
MKANLVRVRERNQITIPGKLLESLKIHVGDFLEVVITSAGSIHLKPTRLVALGTPAAAVHEREASEQIASGSFETFDSGKEFASHLERRSQKSEKVRGKVLETSR